MPNKWEYERIIQGNFGHGWEDVSCYEATSDGNATDCNLVRDDLSEYRRSGIGLYRVISRRSRIE